ncbi:MAG TPA: PAS domain S-box protein, partial [Abditibacteriaceae bacterium]
SSSPTSASSASNLLHKNLSHQNLSHDKAKYFLASIVESSQDSIVTVDSEGIITSWNRAAEQLYGYSAQDAIGQSLMALVLPQNLQQVLCAIDRVKHSHKVERFDSVRVHKDGHDLLLEVVMSPVKDGEGKVIGVSTIARDVTLHHQAEAQERFRILVEGAHEFAIFMLSVENKILTWNSGAQHITGFTEAEAVGQSGEIFFTPEDCAARAPHQEMQTATQVGHASDERWHLRKGGERFWASGVMMARRDESGNITNFIKIFRDATGERLAGQKLKASEARFRTLADAVPQLIWTNDAQGEANYFNGRWYDYSGLSYEESYGLGWQAIVHPDDALPSVTEWHQALARGEVFDTQYRLRRVDGSYRWHIGRNVPLLNEEGEIIAWFGTATDIQDLKETQEALWQAHDQLEERVQERTAELQQSKVALEQEVRERLALQQAREELMKRLVSAQEEERHRISRDLHDVLGQDLTALLMILQLLPAQLLPEHVEKLKDSVKGLIHRVQRLAWEMRPAELDSMGLQFALKEYVQEWRDQYGIQANFVHNVVIGTERYPEAIETALYRIVQEALTNVQRHAGAKQVSVILEKSQSTLTAIVEDDGQGFDPEKDEQGHGRPASHRLGLLGMQERMEIVGGTLTIESRPGQGTTVYARAPLSKIENPFQSLPARSAAS